MDLFFYGTSLTAQKNGYVKELKSLLPEANINFLGLSSGQINGAAICKLLNTLNKSYEYYFIDWFSCNERVTDENELNKILDFFVYSVVKNNSIPIFLFFPRADYYQETDYGLSRVKMYELGEKYALKHNIPFIQIYKDKKIEFYFLDKTYTNIVIKDSVHTTETGSRFYAQVIHKELMNNIYCNSVMPNIDYIDKTNNEYFLIKTCSVANNKINKLTLKGNFKIIAIEQILGTFSGKIKATLNEDEQQEILNWDVYCHYTRKVYTLQFKDKFYNSIVIEQLKKDFDRSSCRRSNVLWPNPENLKLDIDKIHYIGDLNSVYE